MYIHYENETEVDYMGYVVMLPLQQMEEKCIYKVYTQGVININNIKKTYKICFLTQFI